MKFPKFLKPYFIKKDELVRLGSIDDGGYVLPLKDVLSSDVLISLGISDNWDFEKHFSKYLKQKLLPMMIQLMLIFGYQNSKRFSQIFKIKDF